VRFGRGYQTPVALTVEEIGKTAQAFASSAARALAAGFQWLEIHAAHGYLLHNFLSPLSNQREDHYGGSFENRVRFLLEVVQAVKRTWPSHLPLAVRLSCTDYTEGGWTLDDTVALCHLLKAAGVDLIDCSSGGNNRAASIPVGPGYQVPFAQTVRKKVGIATAAVGLITDPVHAEEILHQEKADLVLLGRQMLRDPNWAFTAAKALDQMAKVQVPSPYLRSV
jgi:2,4-dienoyl-CoA reductase-like NADH-dependent reductase (Old Yellow Enzyme family)